MSLRVRIVIAAVCGVLAVALMAGYAASVRNQASAQREGALERYGGETAEVCVTTRAVSRGETFSERNVATVDWLVDLLPEGALADTSQLMGKTAASTIASNTPLSDVDVDTQASPLDVPEGTSALSVPCSAQSAVGGALTPGARVDTYLVSDGSAHLLSSGVQVLQSSSGSTGANLSWVTIAVDPSEVEAIVAASSLQKLYFVLPSDDQADPPEHTSSDASLDRSSVLDAAVTEEGAAAAQQDATVPTEDATVPTGDATVLAQVVPTPAEGVPTQTGDTAVPAEIVPAQTAGAVTDGDAQGQGV